jgi:hypothetical protein
MVEKKEPQEDSGIFKIAPILPNTKVGIPILTKKLNVRKPPIVSKNHRDFGHNYDTFLGNVRDIRVNAQDLQDLLFTLQEKNEIIHSTTRSAEIQEFLKKYRSLFKKNEEEIKECLNAIPHLMKEESSLYDYNGDEIGIIENLWDRCSLELSSILKVEDESSLSSQISTAQSLLHDIIFHAGLITIPSRAYQHLDDLMTGQPLDFHETFKDELPKEEDRLKILQYLSAHPGSIEGIVVPEKGIIYKASRKRSHICKSILLITGMVLVGALICYFAENITGFLAISLPEHAAGTSIFTAYLLIMLGGAFHIGIDALKQVRSGEKEFLALEKGFLWIQVKEVPIIMSIFSLWVGLLFLIFYSTAVDWKVAFFAGYSIDSVVDLFLKRFTTSASATLKSLSSS